MDEAMGDDAKDLGPFQRSDFFAAEPEDAVTESMDETMDSDSHPRPAGFHSRPLCPAEPDAVPTAPPIGSPRPDHWTHMTKLQKKTGSDATHEGNRGWAE